MEVGGPLLRRFLDLAGERLRGNWVVIGGCVLPLRGVEHRTTLDIDIAGPDSAGMKDTLVLCWHSSVHSREVTLDPEDVTGPTRSSTLDYHR